MSRRQWNPVGSSMKQKSSEHSEEHTLKDDYKESGAASAEQEPVSHTSEGTADAKTSNVDVYKEQKTVETTEKHTLRNALIAIAIIAVLCLLALYLWHHVSIKLPPAKITFTTTLSTSSTSIVPTPATQVRILRQMRQPTLIRATARCTYLASYRRRQNRRTRWWLSRL